MPQRKGKKILIYFFLLLTVGSINNTDLNKLRFKGIEDINIVGLGNYYNAILLQEIKNLNLGNIFFINDKKIINQINSNSLVEQYEIFKRYPSSLDIKIDKAKFLAKINNNGKIFLVGTNGKFSENNFSNNQLPFIFGKANIEEFLNFKKIIDQSKISYNGIKNFYFFSSKRWDLELNNGIIIKLSKNYPKDSLDFAFEFLYNQNLKDIKIIDARVKNQIILND
jgi:cell division protein FtsQ